MEIKKDDWVLVEGDAPKGYGDIAKQQKSPVLVYMANNQSQIYCKTVGMYYNKFASNAFIIDGKILKTITGQEAKRIITKLNKEGKKEAVKRDKELKDKHISIYKRKDYDLNSRGLLSTGYNFCKKYTSGIVKDTTEGLSINQNQYQATCCDFSKTTNDIVIYIPKTWLNYYGYNLTDLKIYLKFLEGCDIGFDAKILGIVDLHKKFGQSPSKHNAILTVEKNNFFLRENETAYEVLLRASNKNMITYLYFILVRYIYNYMYWNIPFLAMKLRKNLPRASNWDCMLLAHNMTEYYGGYALTTVIPSQILIATKNTNTQKDILNKLGDSKNTMNNSFTKLIPDNQNYSNSSIRKLIKEENYGELQKIIDYYKTI